MAWVVFLFTNLIFALIFLFLVRNRLIDILEGARQSLASRKEELGTKSSLESSIGGNLGKLVELDALAEKIIEYRSYNARLRAIRGRQLISRTELEALETRLRELNEGKGVKTTLMEGASQGKEGENTGYFTLPEELRAPLKEVGLALDDLLVKRDEIKDLLTRLGDEGLGEKTLEQMGELISIISAIKGDQ